MPITVKLEGRLGNQMFQIANCIAHSIRHGMEYQIPQQTTHPELWPVYFRHFPPLKVSMDNFGYYRELGHGYTPVPRKEQICFMGYFQSYKYFWDKKEQVFQAFEPAFAQFDHIHQAFNYKGKVAIHVRRGDYVELNTKHPPIGVDYIRKAVMFFYNNGYNLFMVYSDDIAWCKENLADLFPDNDDIGIGFMDRQINTNDPVTDPLFDLCTMSHFEHQIISNSTFSVWAALLNRNPNKIVVTPALKDWFGPDLQHLDISEMLPPEWIQADKLGIDLPNPAPVGKIIQETVAVKNDFWCQLNALGGDKCETLCSECSK
jgi:hypothetical protein